MKILNKKSTMFELLLLRACRTFAIINTELRKNKLTKHEP
jgi:hypothetical protein